MSVINNDLADMVCGQYGMDPPVQAGEKITVDGITRDGVMSSLGRGSVQGVGLGVWFRGFVHRLAWGPYLRKDVDLLNKKFKISMVDLVSK